MALFVFASWALWSVGQLIIPETQGRFIEAKAFASPASPADGLEVYKQFCINCHAANGKGDDTMKKVMTTIPDFTSDKWQKEINDAQISVSITDGKGTLMPAFAGKVEGDQVQALVEYIRKFDSSRSK
jgi:mono/diheme cytochrome c family protein